MKCLEEMVLVLPLREDKVEVQEEAEDSDWVLQVTACVQAVEQ